ncbi:MAG: hypothetical protein WAO58_05230 [Fimbriimonadaceae bacterium]
MELKHARSLIGQEASVTWKDRNGEDLSRLIRIYDAGFIPLYGACLSTDVGHIQLERITSCKPASAA